MEDTRKVVYFKRNVSYTVGGRFSTQDAKGFVLNREQPWVSVSVDNLRDFKVANRRALVEGLMVETDEPSVDWETPNALTDEVIDELLKNYLKLKATVVEVTSEAILAKMVERAKQQNKSAKTISLIQNRLDEVSTTEVLKPDDMRGVS
jgi:predicted HNH restriction endonuclease